MAKSRVPGLPAALMVLIQPLAPFYWTSNPLDYRSIFMDLQQLVISGISFLNASSD